MAERREERGERGERREERGEGRGERGEGRGEGRERGERRKKVLNYGGGNGMVMV